jgi:D-alanyl-D-alanine carboxypeptidase (penicillin-binding protein 5/6)
MKKKGARLLACLFAVLFLAGGSGSRFWGQEVFRVQAESAEAAEGEPKFTLYAQSAVLMDADSGRILYEKNGYEQRPMASTTKIMTCILALECGNPDDIYTVSSYAASMPKVKLGASSGEQYRMEDLLYSLMLESHNDTAVILAEGVAGSVQEFAAMMNQKARDIGANDTYFITPNGLDAQDEQGVHSTTAADLARILRYCFTQSPKKEEFLAITRTVSYQFQDVSGKHSHSVNNKNSFLSMMEGALTGKTGFTGNAGYCYVGALSRDGKTYIVALLACGWPNNKTYKWKDTMALMNYGLEAYEYREIFNGDGFTDQVRVVGGEEETVPVVLSGSVEALVRAGEEAEVSWWLEEEIPAPVEAGQIVGYAGVSVGGERLASLPLKTASGVKARTLSDCLNEILARFFLQNPAF